MYVNKLFNHRTAGFLFCDLPLQTTNTHRGIRQSLNCVIMGVQYKPLSEIEKQVVVFSRIYYS